MRRERAAAAESTVPATGGIVLAVAVLAAGGVALAGLATLALAQQHPPRHPPHAPGPDAGTPAADAGVAAPTDGGLPDAATPDGGPVVSPPIDRNFWSGERDETDRERDSWRVPPDLVDPFPELHGRGVGPMPNTDADDSAHLRPLRPRSWYLIEEDLVDPWNPGDRRAYRVSPCEEGMPCGAVVEGARRLSEPTTLGARRAADANTRLRRTNGIDVSLLAGAATLGTGDARPRLEAQLALRQGTFLLGLGISVSGGNAAGIAVSDARGLYPDVRGYGRHGAYLALGHRLTDGTLRLDLALELGAILSMQSTLETQVLPLVRLAATGGLVVARGVAILVRLDAGTTLVAPNGWVVGPTAFELGLSLGVRLGSD